MPALEQTYRGEKKCIKLWTHDISSTYISLQSSSSSSPFIVQMVHHSSLYLLLSYLLVSSLRLSFGQYCRPSACSDPVPQPIEPSMFRCAAGILPLPQSSSIHPFVGIACGRCVFTLFFRHCGFLAGIRLKPGQEKGFQAHDEENHLQGLCTAPFE